MSTSSQSSSGRRWLIGCGLAIALAAIFLAVGLPRLLNRPSTATPGEGEIVTAFIGNLAAGATASGQLVAQRSAQLSAPLAGTVTEVFVRVGDVVQAGDKLLAVDSAALTRAVDSAQQSVIIQTSNLTSLLAPPAPADVAAAEAAVASARASLVGLQAGPDAATLAAAEANVRAAAADVAAATARLNSLTPSADPDAVRAAQIELELAQTAARQAAEQHSSILVTEPNQFLSAERLADLELSARAAAVQANARLAAAQDALNQLQQGDPNAIAAARASLNAAGANRDAAQARLVSAQAGPSPAQIAAAQANLTQAEASLARLQRGPSTTQRIAAEIAVEQARIALQRAENNLARATLTAPFDGLILAVNASPGEEATGIVVEMVDNGSLEVRLSVDEIDLANLAVGQPASVTLEAWPDDLLSATVATIAPQATLGPSALVTFDVYLSLEAVERPIMLGMTASAALVTAESRDVLLVPNAAINADRAAGVYSVILVQRAEDGSLSYASVPVTIGLRDDNNTEIKSGLQAGDELLVGDPNAAVTFGPGQGRGGPPDGN